jgi:putative Holliday junction resolvase
LDGPGRLCGIDHGSKRIGLAVSDPDRSIASPLATLTVTGDLARQVGAVIEAAGEYDPAAWVVGLPLNMDGSEGPQAKAARRFGDELARISGKPVCYADERLSSQEADDCLRPADLTRGKHKQRRDRVAAQIILQDFLDGQDSDATG